MNTSTKGTCAVCNSEVSKQGALKHLCKCTAGEISPGDNYTGNYFYIRVQGKDKNYWLDICAGKGSTLSDLDKLLRKVWLDCCGHMSAFEINGKRYEVDSDYPIWGMKTEKMNIELYKVFTGADNARYQYDFGSTTELSIHVLGSVHVDPAEGEVELLIRNVNPYKGRVNSPRAGVCGYPFREK